MVQLNNVKKEKDVLKKEVDSLHDERNALQIEKNVMQIEREASRAGKENLQRSLDDEREMRLALEKRASDECDALLGIIGRVNDGMRALHARFSWIGALRYAEGYRDCYTDRSPPEGQTSSYAGPDDVDSELKINPLGVYTDPAANPAERIFEECKEIASSGVIAISSSDQPLDVPPQSTMIPPATVAEGETQQNEVIIQLDSPPRGEGIVNDGEENVERGQETEGADRAS